jgi:hypothetical protein
MIGSPSIPLTLAMKAPVVEKDADAEAIFWEVRINDSGEELIFSHYIRINEYWPAAMKALVPALA